MTRRHAAEAPVRKGEFVRRFRFLCILAALVGVELGVNRPGRDALSAGDKRFGGRECHGQVCGPEVGAQVACHRKHVSMEMNDTGQYEWRLHVRSDLVSSWERLTLHTNHGGGTRPEPIAGWTRAWGSACWSSSTRVLLRGGGADGSIRSKEADQAAPAGAVQIVEFLHEDAQLVGYEWLVEL
ncbi:hypothetical protein HUT18_21255 [Streptomyces sp. NA04227]|uniref:hypothetical protein n=1 Tax=Streptomyces sp. NA04227 TaxID=2742136 RepID=UPI00158FDEAA|nr:hypothetical protein [Streptomyces sp. NA04227]QKW08516.1 hypothetical protein HUT18_21255 [Streptomyces sp. NA04227]